MAKATKAKTKTVKAKPPKAVKPKNAKVKASEAAETVALNVEKKVFKDFSAEYIVDGDCLIAAITGNWQKREEVRAALKQLCEYALGEAAKDYDYGKAKTRCIRWVKDGKPYFRQGLINLALTPES